MPQVPPLIPLTPERAQAAKGEIADAVLPHVRTLARQRLGPVKYFVLKPFLRTLIIDGIELIVAGLAPEFLPFLDVLLAVLAVIDPAKLTDDARRTLATILGLMRTQPSPEVAYAMAHPDDSDFRVSVCRAVGAPEPIRRPM